MRKMKKTAVILALLLTAVTGAWAQANNDDRKVKRITFDQEQVNVEYSDGTTEEGVNKLSVVNDRQVTGIKTAKPTTQETQTRWYTTDGRSLQGEPRKKGVYIVKEKNSVKKTIKK